MQTVQNKAGCQEFSFRLRSTTLFQNVFDKIIRKKVLNETINMKGKELHMKKIILASLIIVLILIAVHFASQWIKPPVEQPVGPTTILPTGTVAPAPVESSDDFMKRIFLQIGSILFLAYVSFYLSKRSGLPIFVMAIVVGMVAKAFFSQIIPNTNILNMLVTFCAALILFGGGLETSLQNFMKMLWPILSIAFIGLLITSFLFALIHHTLNPSVSVIVSVLLGAILASTDPAAIIPTLGMLKFKNDCVKDLVVSESAVNDVSGSMVTLLFVGILSIAGTTTYTLGSLYHRLLSAEAMNIFGVQLGVGVLAGAIGFGLLYIFQRLKTRHDQEYASDLAFMMGIPVVSYFISFEFGGSGFLAAFIAGLLCAKTSSKIHQMHETEASFNKMIDAFFKPLIFLLLGALVDPATLLKYAPMGISMAMIFMLIIRPIAVFTTIPPVNWGKNKLGIKDLLFIAFVRETGAIPAVLIVITASTLSSKLPGLEPLVPVGMWVILMTLIIQPIFTGMIAQKLGVAELKK
jgi:NhaP-type Na+/H+ or K+/H+ antiporter